MAETNDAAVTSPRQAPTTAEFAKMITRKDRRLTVYQTKIPRPRWMLHMQATFWRVLMSLGMFFHRLAPPRPPKPNFTRTIPSTISGTPGHIALHFYVPGDYHNQQKLYQNTPRDDSEDAECDDGDGGRGARLSSTFTNVSHSIRRRISGARKWGGYPVVVNFHGGGFTLGTATDDARWCGTVVDECHAVVVSVDYRLAPECPFPTAVEDGADSVLWVHEHADELGIDKDKIALSGFSSGANMAFTVPLRLYDELMGFPRSGATTPATSRLNVAESVDPKEPPPPIPGQPIKTDTNVTERHLQLREVSIRCIVPWYPSLDYTRTREQRRATCVRKDQELPALFTDLFDESYLHPPHTIALDSPYLSPGVAPTDLLREALPDEIIMHTCEWDMLLDEGVAFRDRLVGPGLNKKVTYQMIAGVPHGWDKAPNPWKPTPGVREHYLRACKELRRVFGARVGVGFLPERPTNAGPSAAPRGSVSVVR